MQRKLFHEALWCINCVSCSIVFKLQASMCASRHVTTDTVVQCSTAAAHPCCQARLGQRCCSNTLHSIGLDCGGTSKNHDQTSSTYNDRWIVSWPATTCHSTRASAPHSEQSTPELQSPLSTKLGLRWRALELCSNSNSLLIGRHPAKSDHLHTCTLRHSASSHG